MATLPPPVEPTHDLLHDLDADLAGLPTGLPASVRAATPPPAVREAELDAPSPSLPPQTPPPVERQEARPSPSKLRVAVEQQLVFHEPTPTPPDERALIPDDHRVEWFLGQILDVATEIAGYARALVSVVDTLAALRRVVERLDQRDDSRQRAERERAALELAATADRTRLQRLVESPHAGRLAAVLTWVGGMISMGLLDYLGLESEPVFRFVALIWGL